MTRRYRRNASELTRETVYEGALNEAIYDAYDLAFPMLKCAYDLLDREGKEFVRQADEDFHRGDPETLVRWARDMVPGETFPAWALSAEPRPLVYTQKVISLLRLGEAPDVTLYAPFRFWNRVQHRGLCIPPVSSGWGHASASRQRSRFGGSSATAHHPLNEWAWTQMFAEDLWNSWVGMSEDTQTELVDMFGCDVRDIRPELLMRGLSLFWASPSKKGAAFMAEFGKRRAPLSVPLPDPTIVKIEPEISQRRGGRSVSHPVVYNWWFTETRTGQNGIVFVVPGRGPQADVSKFEVVSGDKRLG